MLFLLIQQVTFNLPPLWFLEVLYKHEIYLSYGPGRFVHVLCV
jgi:hypothetical protein